jgi:cytoskeletal protein CcmA (bactofilin family)
MWKRDEQQKSTSDVKPSATPSVASPAPPPPSPPLSGPDASARSVAAPAAANLGSSLSLKGEISGSEDLVLYGRVEGKVSVPGHVLTIAPNAEISAEVLARAMIIHGSMTGNVTATERFEIRSSGRMMGDVTCPSVVMSEGSEFSGRVDMRRTFGSSEGAPKDKDRRRGSE